MSPTDTPPTGQIQRGEAEAYEEKNVHEVYQQIAEHFSSTRYKVHLTPLNLLYYIYIYLSLFLVTNSIAMANCRTVPPKYHIRRCWSRYWMWEWQVSARK